MRLLRKHTATLTRHSSDGYWDEVNESWVKGTTTSDIIKCNIQPYYSSGIEQEKLPEGISQSDTRTIRTKTILKTGNEKDRINADVVSFLNIDYEVFSVREWFAADKLSHYEATMIRKDKL